MVATLLPSLYMHDFTLRIQMVTTGKFMPIENVLLTLSLMVTGLWN